MMSKIVRTIARISFPLVLTFGFYLVVHGHLTPGGGFQGGAVIATGVALVAVALGIEALGGARAEWRLNASESLGLLMFIGLALLGIGVTFFHNWILGTPLPFSGRPPFGPNPGYLNTGGTLPLMNLAVGIEVLGGLGAIIYYMMRGGGE